MFIEIEDYMSLEQNWSNVVIWFMRHEDLMNLLENIDFWTELHIQEKKANEYYDAKTDDIVEEFEWNTVKKWLVDKLSINTIDWIDYDLIITFK